MISFHFQCYFFKLWPVTLILNWLSNFTRTPFPLQSLSQISNSGLLFLPDFKSEFLPSSPGQDWLFQARKTLTQIMKKIDFSRRKLQTPSSLTLGSFFGMSSFLVPPSMYPNPSQVAIVSFSVPALDPWPDSSFGFWPDLSVTDSISLERASVYAFFCSSRIYKYFF